MFKNNDVEWDEDPEPYGAVEVFSHVFSNVSPSGEQRIDFGNLAQVGERVFILSRIPFASGIWEVRSGTWALVRTVSELKGHIIFPQFGNDRPILVHETGCRWIRPSLDIHRYSRDPSGISSLLDFQLQTGALELVAAGSFVARVGEERDRNAPLQNPSEPKQMSELDLIIDLLRDS
jgi:hypothetical protein